MIKFVHPPKEDITLPGILDALADPLRLQIVRFLLTHKGEEPACQSDSCPEIAKSTLSNHFRILREAGVIRMKKQGVETRSTVREAEINELFPGLLAAIIKFVPDCTDER